MNFYIAPPASNIPSGSSIVGPPMPAAGATSAAPSTSGTSSGADDEGSSTGPASR